MAGVDDLKTFIEGKQAYREGVVNATFPAYQTCVTTLPYESLKDHILDDRNHYQVASVQGGLDIVAASERAVDIRVMKPADYRKAYRESHQGQTGYENSKLDRFKRGAI